MKQANFKRILIIKPSSLGDIIQALPVLSALRKNFPDARISWLIRPDFAPLIEEHPYLNEIISFDRNFLGKAWFHPGALLGLLSLIRRLRHSNFDIVIDLQGLLRTALLGWLTGCKNRFGMANTREFAPIFYTKKIEQDSTCVHVADYYLKVIKAAGIDCNQVDFCLPVEAAAERISGLLNNHQVNRANYAVFVPGSAHREKCWPIVNFAGLADKLATNFSLSIIAVGTHSEKDITGKLKSCAETTVVDFAGATELAELVALLKGARLVVSNDTGPGHIAAALGVPVVLIFGLTNPQRVGPYGRKDSVAAIDSDLRGLHRFSKEIKHKIDKITIEMVYEKACLQLETQGATGTKKG